MPCCSFMAGVVPRQLIGQLSYKTCHPGTLSSLVCPCVWHACVELFSCRGRLRCGRWWGEAQVVWLSHVHPVWWSGQEGAASQGGASQASWEEEAAEALGPKWFWSATEILLASDYQPQNSSDYDTGDVKKGDNYVLKYFNCTDMAGLSSSHTCVFRALKQD